MQSTPNESNDNQWEMISTDEPASADATATATSADATATAASADATADVADATATPVRPPAYILCGFVADRSGSTASMKESQQRAYPKFVNDRKKDSVETGAKVLLHSTEFDDHPTVFHNWVDVQSLEQFTERELNQWFSPRGSTRLIDTMYESLTEMKRKFLEVEKSLKEGNESNQKIVGIWACITDGLDNMSRIYSYDQVSALVRELRGMGMQIFFLGANQDAIATATRMGIAPGAALNMAATRQHSTAAYRALSAGMTRAVTQPVQRSAPGVLQTPVTFTAAERETSAPPLQRQNAGGFGNYYNPYQAPQMYGIPPVQLLPQDAVRMTTCTSNLPRSRMTRGITMGSAIAPTAAPVPPPVVPPPVMGGGGGRGHAGGNQNWTQPPVATAQIQAAAAAPAAAPTSSGAPVQVVIPRVSTSNDES